MASSPGPWRLLDVERVVDAGGYLVASVSGRINEGSYETNGRLIAAAPELRDALKEHMDNCRDCSWLQVGEPDRCQRCARSFALLSRIDPIPTRGGTP